MLKEEDVSEAEEDHEDEGEVDEEEEEEFDEEETYPPQLETVRAPEQQVRRKKCVMPYCFKKYLQEILCFWKYLNSCYNVMQSIENIFLKLL